MFLEKNQVLIEYNLLKKYLYTFCINSDTTVFIKQQIDSSFNADLNSCIKFTNDANCLNFNNNEIRNFAKASNKVYNKLLKPIKSIIQDKRLTFVPDADLNFLAFGTLITSNNKNNIHSFDSLPYLIYSNSVSYESSAYLMKIMTNSVSKNNNNVAAFVPQYKNNADGNMHLDNLKAANREIEGLFNSFGGKKYFGETATKDNFFKEAGKYGILHLVLHTIINSDNSLLSGLAFSDNETNLKSNIVRTYELYNKNLNNEMVVLSTCNAGVGPIVAGEGVLNIARGFIYSGCKSLLITL